MTEDTKKFSTETILAAVSRAFLVSLSQLTSSSKLTPTARARFAAMWLLREMGPPMTLKKIAEALGAKDHTTALNGLVRARECMDRYDDFRMRLGAARQMVLASATDGRPQAFEPVMVRRVLKGKRPPEATHAAQGTKRNIAPATNVVVPLREPAEVIEMRRSVAMADRQFARLLKNAQRAPQ